MTDPGGSLEISPTFTNGICSILPCPHRAGAYVWASCDGWEAEWSGKASPGLLARGRWRGRPSFDRTPFVWGWAGCASWYTQVARRPYVKTNRPNGAVG